MKLRWSLIDSPFIIVAVIMLIPLLMHLTEIVIRFVADTQ